MPVTPQKRRRMIMLLALLGLFAAIAYTSFAIEHPPEAVAQQIPEPLPLVSVVETAASVYQARVQGHGEARPRFELTLKAEVTGRVTMVSSDLESGRRLDTETVLVTTDPILFRQGIAAAKQSLAEATLLLLQEQRESERARDNWQRAQLGDEKASSLVLREPQLEAAQARVDNAQAMLARAEQNLALTNIKAPFDAVVIERLVALGQFVQAGDAIATLHSINRIDVRIRLPLQQWSLLEEEDQLIGNDSVMLTSITGEQWSGVITQVDQHVDSNSRQRSLVVSVYNPLQQSQPLLAGTFLTAELLGANRKNVLEVPASSLTSAGNIWYVTDANILARFSAHIVFQQKSMLYVRAPERLDIGIANDSLAVLIAPLPSYILGQAVMPQTHNEVSQR